MLGKQLQMQQSECRRSVQQQMRIDHLAVVSEIRDSRRQLVRLYIADLHLTMTTDESESPSRTTETLCTGPAFSSDFLKASSVTSGGKPENMIFFIAKFSVWGDAASHLTQPEKLVNFTSPKMGELRSSDFYASPRCLSFCVLCG